MNQLKPVLIEDFNEIKRPSSLQYSPDEKTLAFTLVQPDKENNKYSKNLWIMEENKEAVQLTSSGKDGDFIWEDDQTILNNWLLKASQAPDPETFWKEIIEETATVGLVKKNRKTTLSVSCKNKF